VLTQDNCVDSPGRAKAPAAVRRDVERSERRRRIRIRLRWTLNLLAPGGTEAIQTVTRDLSSCGFYCWSSLPFVPGEQLIAILTAPAHNRERPDCVLPIECNVRIVRVEPPNRDGLYGLGCEITDYRISCGPPI
jgi:hypothetical protein